MDRPDDVARPLEELCLDIIERYHDSLHRALPRIREDLAALESTVRTLKKGGHAQDRERTGT
jgi:hypothetical protein